MKKIICFIFGHLFYTYNGGTYESPEEAYGCEFCSKDLEDAHDEFLGFDLNHKITKWFLDRENNKFIEEGDFPF